MFRSIFQPSYLSVSTRPLRNGSVSRVQRTLSSSSGVQLRQGNEPAAGSPKKDATPQRTRGGDEEGVKTDDVASTNAAFQPGLSSEQAAKGIEKETGDSLQSSPANPKASKPKGPQQGVSDATDEGRK
ncbi:hypothetical protein BDY24DRAFT_442411 [Mrakia frigida]|uniref:uncharacterized protein n=1 Tax=Mrakia frigida TaxID=29902 RepID=UPI003FCC16BF